jgi:hypothetical protein
MLLQENIEFSSPELVKIKDSFVFDLSNDEILKSYQLKLKKCDGESTIFKLNKPTTQLTYKSSFSTDETVENEFYDINIICKMSKSNILLGEVRASYYYLAHYNNPEFYIQCDQHGRAFVHRCPPGMKFTINLVCEKFAAHSRTLPFTKPLLTIKSRNVLKTILASFYEKSKIDMEINNSTIHSLEWVEESPEFDYLCSKNTSISLVLPHPSNNSLYIKCDMFYHAYVNICPFGHIFTTNLQCEKEESDQIEPSFRSINNKMKLLFNISSNFN